MLRDLRIIILCLAPEANLIVCHQFRSLSEKVPESDGQVLLVNYVCVRGSK